MSILYRIYKSGSEKFRKLKRSDQKEANRQFYKRFGNFPDFKNPKSFSEKITYFKISADRPLFRDLADKSVVRDYVANLLHFV